MPMVKNQYVRTLLGCLGCCSFYACGPLASSKVRAQMGGRALAPAALQGESLDRGRPFVLGALQ